jgi:hypothetical protein
MLLRADVEGVSNFDVILCDRVPLLTTASPFKLSSTSGGGSNHTLNGSKMAASPFAVLYPPAQKELDTVFFAVINQHVKLRKLYEPSLENPTPRPMVGDSWPLVGPNPESKIKAIYASEFALGLAGVHLQELLPRLTVEHCSTVFSGDFLQRMRCPLLAGSIGAEIIRTLPLALRVKLIAAVLCNSKEEVKRLSELIKLENTLTDDNLLRVRVRVRVRVHELTS